MLMWQSRKQNKPQAVSLSAEWLRIMENTCLFFHRLPAADRDELAGHVQQFLAKKRFEGCGGLEMDDRIRICVAAHACLLLLHRPTDCFPRLRSVLVYPNMYVVPTVHHVGSGIMAEVHQQRAGESWPGGAVVLAWDVMCSHIAAPENGHNLALHEFAHQLDFEDGQANGVPALGRGESWPDRRRRYLAWARVMRGEFERLRTQVLRGEATVLRDYGATNAAEFFAVATECFFCKPVALKQEHPELYAEMQWYYQQDPTGWDWSSPEVRGNG